MRHRKTTGVDAPKASLCEVERYWSEHLNLTQFLRGQEIAGEIGSEAFFAAVRCTLQRFPYKEALLNDIWANRSGDRLLEIGCGLGADLVSLAQKGFQVVGVDLSARVAALGARHLRTLCLPGMVEVADAERLPFADAAFDEVFSSGVFQHTPDPQRAIDEAIRVLRPGGQMTVVLYHRHSWFWVLSRVGKTHVEFQDEEAPIVEAYSRRELRRMFAALVDLTIAMEHYRPLRTPRAGIVPSLYNRVLVPVAEAIPAPVLRPFGFHAVIRGRKPG